MVFQYRPLRRNALQNALQGIFSKKYPKKYPKSRDFTIKKVARRRATFGEGWSDRGHRDYTSPMTDCCSLSSQNHLFESNSCFNLYKSEL